MRSGCHQHLFIPLIFISWTGTQSVWLPRKKVPLFIDGVAFWLMLTRTYCNKEGGDSTRAQTTPTQSIIGGEGGPSLEIMHPNFFSFYVIYWKIPSSSLRVYTHSVRHSLRHFLSFRRENNTFMEERWPPGFLNKQWHEDKRGRELRGKAFIG